MRKKILIADCEKDIIDLVSQNLEQEGFEVLKAYDGRQAWERVNSEKPDLLILDMMVPVLLGMEVCRMIRRQDSTSSLPIIMLTAKSDPIDIDKVLGLEVGADDCIAKPFNVRELIARVRAVLRRARTPLDDTLPESFSFGGLKIDGRSCRVTVDGRSAALTPREFKLLQFLIRYPGRVYSRDQLLDRVWGGKTHVTPRAVDVHIRRLRAAIEPGRGSPRYILTVHGHGYKFTDAEE